MSLKIQHLNSCREVYNLRTFYFSQFLRKSFPHKNGSSIFVQNAELHTYGFNADDLGLGIYMNAVIINSILGYEHYAIEGEGVFQGFGTIYVKYLHY